MASVRDRRHRARLPRSAARAPPRVTTPSRSTSSRPVQFRYTLGTVEVLLIGDVTSMGDRRVVNLPIQMSAWRCRAPLTIEDRDEFYSGARSDRRRWRLRFVGLSLPVGPRNR